MLIVKETEERRLANLWWRIRPTRDIHLTSARVNAPTTAAALAASSLAVPLSTTVDCARRVAGFDARPTARGPPIFCFCAPSYCSRCAGSRAAARRHPVVIECLRYRSRLAFDAGAPYGPVHHDLFVVPQPSTTDYQRALAELDAITSSDDWLSEIRLSNENKSRRHNHNSDPT